MGFRYGVYEKNQHHLVIKDIAVAMNTFIRVVMFVVQAFVMQ